MERSIAFHPDASEEFIEASIWYESKRPGLAPEFIKEINRCVILAAQQPLQFTLVYAEIRRIVAHRFPYSVYFRVEENRIVVLAVFHSSRETATWLARILPENK